MSLSLRPFRSRLCRLLASSVLAMALLVNGMGMAHAVPAPAKHDCCGQMAGHAGGKPCPAPDSRCDEQCLMRCQATSVLPMPAMGVATVSASDPLLPAPGAGLLPLADAGPALRPPISV